jgi:CheY-like chemotaxis protein
MATILIIEDEHTLREELVQVLELEGYTGIGAADGRAGVDMIRSYRPDLILCDIMMPVLDGYGVLEEIRADEMMDSIPFIFMSAKASPTEAIAGITDYLEKPATIQEILTMIEKYLY